MVSSTWEVGRSASETGAGEVGDPPSCFGGGAEEVVGLR